MTRRERSIFAAVVDAVVDPEPPLPPVAETDAVAAFERWLAAAPPLNRTALRALLYLAEVAPRVLGEGARLRTLPRAGRLRTLRRLGAPADALRSLAAGCYWGDASALRAIEVTASSPETPGSRGGSAWGVTPTAHGGVAAGGVTPSPAGGVVGRGVAGRG